jgi:hypothetical protein
VCEFLGVYGVLSVLAMPLVTKLGCWDVLAFRDGSRKGAKGARRSDGGASVGGLSFRLLRSEREKSFLWESDQDERLLFQATAAQLLSPNTRPARDRHSVYGCIERLQRFFLATPFPGRGAREARRFRGTLIFAD